MLASLYSIKSVTMIPAHCLLPALSLAWRPALSVPARRPVAVRMMAKLPARVDALVDPQVDRPATAPIWAAFRKVYRTEDDAVAALERNGAVILPFINTPENIRVSWKAIQDKFDADEAYDIVTRNPGILANRPGDLENSSVGAIRGSMALVTALDGVPEQIRFAIPTLTGLTIVGLIGSRLAECSGGTCG